MSKYFYDIFHWHPLIGNWELRSLVYAHTPITCVSLSDRMEWEKLSHLICTHNFPGNIPLIWATDCAIHLYLFKEYDRNFLENHTDTRTNGMSMLKLMFKLELNGGKNWIPKNRMQKVSEFVVAILDACHRFQFY